MHLHIRRRTCSYERHLYLSTFAWYQQGVANTRGPARKQQPSRALAPSFTEPSPICTAARSPCFQIPLCCSRATTSPPPPHAPAPTSLHTAATTSTMFTQVPGFTVRASAEAYRPCFILAKRFAHPHSCGCRLRILEWVAPTL